MPRASERKEKLESIHMDTRLAVIQLLNVERALSAASTVHQVRQARHLTLAIEAAEEVTRLVRSLKRQAKRLK
jgi:hypothetical protein